MPVFIRYIVVSLIVLVPVLALQSGSVFSQDQSLSRFLLIKLSRDQTAVLCGSEQFTQCMGFTEKECLVLGEKAIEQCLMPLPERIELDQLSNDTIESCPRLVYEEAGYSDEKAQECLAGALEQ